MLHGCRRWNHATARELFAFEARSPNRPSWFRFIYTLPDGCWDTKPVRADRILKYMDEQGLSKLTRCISFWRSSRNPV